MHFRLQVQEIHLAHVRVVIVERFLHLVVSFVHFGLGGRGKALHFEREEVIVVIGLELDFLVVHLAHDGIALLLQVRLESLLARKVLPKVERLDKFGLHAPKGAHLGKVIDTHGVAVAVNLVAETGSRANQHGNIERRQDRFRLQGANLVLLGIYSLA